MNHFINFPTVCCASFVFVLVFSGCSSEKRPPGFPKLYPVSLKVIQEGKPLSEAAVSLRKADNSMTWSIGGRTDERGIAVLRTHGKFNGAPEGMFKVTVEKVINEGEAEMIQALDREDQVAAKRIQVNSFSFVKDEYNSMEKTPIEIEITRKSKVIEVNAGPAVKMKREYMR